MEVSSKAIQSISSVDVECLASETGNAFNGHHLSNITSAREVDASMPDRASSMSPLRCANYCQSRSFVDDMYAAISSSIADSIPYSRSDCFKRLEIHGEMSRPVTVRGRPHSLFRQNGLVYCEQQSEHPTNQASIRTTRHSDPISIYPPSISRSPSINACIEEQGDRACPSVSGRLSVSTLESGDVSVSCFHVGHHGISCHPSLYIHLRRRDPMTIDLLRRRRCMSACHRKQFYTAGAMLIMIGITSVIVNVVGIVIHASWTFTGIGIWSGICVSYCCCCLLISPTFGYCHHSITTLAQSGICDDLQIYLSQLLNCSQISYV